MREFSSGGTVSAQDVALPALTAQHKLDMKFSLLPERTNHTHNFIIGMKDLRQLGTFIDSKTNTIKWNGMTASMENKGH